MDEIKANSLESELFDGHQFEPQVAVALRYLINSMLPVATTGMYGRSHLAGNQTIATGTVTKVLFDTNDLANGITWDGINHRFTCLTAGKYLITTMLGYNNPTIDKLYVTSIEKNGIIIFTATTNCSASGNPVSLSITDIVSLSVGDYIETFTNHNAGVNQDVYGTSGTSSYLSIIKVG